jgi:hypothetical protein
MFRVETQRSGIKRQIFTWENPRKDGYKGDVEDGVTLDHNEEIYLYPSGSDLPVTCLGRSRSSPKEYKVFKHRRDLDAAGYEYVSAGTPPVLGSWLDYVRLHLDPPNPEEIDEEDWFNYLDKVDDEARRLNKRSPWPETPKDASRESVAEWLAKQHFIMDPTIREIYYLPQGAPANEIRFLEISERLTGNEGKVTPLDFGVEELGVRFRLAIADVSGDHLEVIRREPTMLPSGWVLDGNTVWRRRDR